MYVPFPIPIYLISESCSQVEFQNDVPKRGGNPNQTRPDGVFMGFTKSSPRAEKKKPATCHDSNPSNQKKQKSLVSPNLERKIVQKRILKLKNARAESPEPSWMTPIFLFTLISPSSSFLTSN